MADMTNTITREQIEHFLLEECVPKEEAALMLEMSVTNFRDLVSAGMAPRPVRGLGSKSVRYIRHEIEAFAMERHKAMTILQAERDAEVKAAAEAKAKRAARAAAAKKTRAMVSA